MYVMNPESVIMMPDDCIIMITRLAHHTHVTLAEQIMTGMNIIIESFIISVQLYVQP